MEPTEEKRLTKNENAKNQIQANSNSNRSLVEVSGIEPLTSCMPCKRSPS